MTSPRKTTEALTVSQFLLPKHGHELSECEDAIGINERVYRFAVSDGATEAFDAGNWSRRLAQSWVNQDGLLSGNDFWRWIMKEGDELTQSWNGQQLSWYSEAKQRIGSFAAFVGVEIDFSDNTPQWTAIALGDSCLMHVRGDELLDSFPISESTRFGSSPVLAPSSAAANSHALNEIAVSSGRLLSGDKLFLMSDAIASWYLMLSERGDSATKSQFDELLDNDTPGVLEEFLELQRAEGRLKNDDIAIVKLTA
jgi:hypothetical protein